MAVAFDGVSSAQTTPPGAGTLAWTSHTIGGTERLLVVGVSIEDTGATVTSITYGAANLTFIGRQAASGAFAVMELWRLIAPATGTATITITLDNSADMVGGAVSFTGVDQTTPAGTFAGATATSTAPSVTVAGASGDMIIDTVAVDSGTQTATVGAGQTDRWNVLISGNVMGVGSTEAGAASVVMSWTLSVSQIWASGGVAVKAAAAAFDAALTAATQYPTQGPTITRYRMVPYGETGHHDA